MMVTLRIAFAAALAASPLTIGAQTDAAARAVAAADSAAAAMLSDSVAGVVIGVFSGATPVFVRPYGMADLSARRPIRTDEVLPIGSITKQLTAAGVLALLDDGRLGLDDPVTRHLPDLSEKFTAVTVRQLLNQTSGIGRYEQAFQLRLPSGVDEVVQTIANAPAEFVAGERFAYNNANYVLLGRIIERATGGSYEAFLRSRFFAPIGMRLTAMCADSLRPSDAVGYLIGTGNPIARPAIPTSLTSTAGGLCSTVEDLGRWARALHTGRVLTPESYQLLITPPQLPGTATMQYAMGVVPARFADRTDLWHNGAITSGFHSMLSYVPQDSLTVVVLMNSFPGRPEATARAVARAWLGLPAPARPAAAPARVSDVP